MIEMIWNFQAISKFWGYQNSSGLKIRIYVYIYNLNV